MRPGAWIRRWGPALAALLVPVTGTFFGRSFRSPEPAARDLRRLAPIALETAAVPPGRHRVSDGAGWREAPTDGFRIGRTEVTVRQYCGYLNQSGGGRETPQILRANGAWTPRKGCAEQAVAWVTAREAEDFCAWLTQASGTPVRLPDTEEWEIAARAGGLAERAGGWSERGERPAGAPPAHAPPENAWGLRGIGGSVFEWCRAGGGWIARDSAWTEPTDAFSALNRCWSPPAGYQDADTGFRVLVAGSPAEED